MFGICWIASRAMSITASLSSTSSVNLTFPFFSSPNQFTSSFRVDVQVDLDKIVEPALTPRSNLVRPYRPFFLVLLQSTIQGILDEKRPKPLALAREPDQTRQFTVSKAH